MKCQVATRTT
jgi:hypothetical protein